MLIRNEKILLFKEVVSQSEIYLCILAEPDANLGLIRLSIRGMQENRG